MRINQLYNIDTIDYVDLRYICERRAKKIVASDQSIGLHPSYDAVNMLYTILLFDQRCFNCWSKYNLTIDHNFPKSKGYAINVRNAVLLCGECNEKKDNIMPAIFYSSSRSKELFLLLGVDKQFIGGVPKHISNINHLDKHSIMLFCNKITKTLVKKDVKVKYAVGYLAKEMVKTLKVFNGRCFRCKSLNELSVYYNFPKSKGFPISARNAILLCCSCANICNYKYPEDIYSKKELKRLYNILEIENVGSVAMQVKNYKLFKKHLKLDQRAAMRKAKVARRKAKGDEQ